MSAQAIEHGLTGPRLVCAGEDTDCASSTVGMGVVVWSRPLTTGERATQSAFIARRREAWADPRGTAREDAADVHREWDAWVASLPRSVV